MRRTSRLARLGHQAIAGAALAALLAWAPFGAAAHAPAYADEPQAWAAAEESFGTGEGASEDQVTFDAVSPEEAAFDATEDVAFSGDADSGAYDESASLTSADDALVASDEDEPLFDDVPAAGADASLILADDAPVTEDGAIAHFDDAPSATEGDTYLPDATDADVPADIADAACLGEDEGIEALASSSVTYDSILKIRGNKSYTLAWQVLSLVNQERAKEGLSALTMDSSLLSAAMLRGGEIAVCFSHTRPTGQTCFTACAKMTGENIAYGYRSAEDVMNGWMNSSGHRANIMNKSFKSIGISCVQVNGSYYWVQCFSTTAATTTSKPADVSNALMSVAYTKDGLTSLNTTFSICPVKSDGTSIDIDGSGSLLVGSSRRYGLFVGNTPIDNSCVTWSISSTVAKLGTPTATVTATGVGSFTLTASVGGGTVKQTLTRTTALPVYTVSFYSNGGSSVTSQSVTSGQKATKPANPTKAGYNFTAWYSDPALTKAYNFSTAVKSNLTLYAGWKQITYTVSFNSNGGSAVASQTVAWGSTATKPASPTKAGYTFTGWYSNSVLTTAYNFSTAVKSNLILYAGWKQITCTVSFSANGGSSTASQTVAWGSTATRPANPTKAGYTFKGWYSDSALTKAYDFATPVKSYLVLYAGWKQITYTVSFNSNGGSAVSSQTVIWNRTAYRPTTPTKDGYTFTGWYSDSALTQAYDFSTAVKSNMTLYAGWKQITYTVTFVINGWYNTAEQTVAWGSKVVKPADPTREGYTFTGWYSDSALTKAYDFATPVKTYLLLYAGWEQTTYVVSFDTSGGSAVSSQTVTWGYRAAKPADPTRDGYTFTGWYSDKVRTQTYSFYSAVKSDLTLYAGWKQITYTVTFERNGGSSTASQTVAWGAKATKPADPVKSEFAFTGWYSDKALTKAYDFGTAVKSNLTLYAGWKQVIFTMSFNSQGGSAVANQKVALGSAATRPADPVKAGCTFTGWYTDTSFKTLYDFGKPVQYNTLLQAGWKQIACTITFNTNGGSSVASQTVAGGEKAVKPANPTKAGYTFAGWYYNKALTVAYDFGTAVESDLTLYAAWRENPAVLTYKDVPAGKWYTYWVAEATEAGLMSGHKGADGKYTGYFEPNGIITRAQVATVLWRIAGSPSASTSAFSDMSGHWAATAVAWCSAKGIVTGYTGGPDAGKFVPDRQVSRQELAVMVWRFAKWAGVNTANPSTVAFYYCSDAALVPAWSREAMTWCASAGIITGIQGNGRPTLSPEAGATRAMAAKIFVHTQWHCAKATGSQSDEDVSGEATQESLDRATFEDVQADAPGNSSSTGTDETFDAVEPGKATQAGKTSDASANKPEQAEESEGADKPAESPDASADTADAGEEPDDGELAPAGGDDAVEAPDASATGTPDDAAETPAEPAEAGEEPSDSEADAASATDVADVTETPAGPAEAATFDAPDALAA